MLSIVWAVLALYSRFECIRLEYRGRENLYVSTWEMWFGLKLQDSDTKYGINLGCATVDWWEI